MKLVRYGARGAEKPGMIDSAGQLRDLSGHLPDIAGDALADLGRLAAIDPETLPLVKGSPRIGACVAGSDKFIGIGLNYADHAEESGMAVPPEPIVFTKFASCICGPDDPIIIPRGSVKTDWEVELAVIIGKGGRYIDEADAMAHVAGYALCNDVSEREFQIERAGQWSKGKCSDNFAPLGPWLLTPDEIADPHKLGLWLDVNGQPMQRGTTATMVYQVPFLIAYLSRFFTLMPGDVISTGTPPGVGMGKKPQVYLKAGDVVTLGGESLGAQRQLCVADDR